MSEGTCAENAQLKVTDELQALVADRENIGSEELCALYLAHVGEQFNRTAHADFLLIEIKRRFKLLSRKRTADGSYPSIDGATSFVQWCKASKVGIRRAYYLIAGVPRNQIVVPRAEPKEKWGRTPQENAIKYLTKFYKNFGEKDFDSAVQEARRRSNEQ